MHARRFGAPLPLAVGLVTAIAAQVALRPVKIPVRANLMIVTAIQDQRGDYESIKRVTAADASLVHIAYSVDRPPLDDASPLAGLFGPECETAAVENKDRKGNVHQTGSRAVDRSDMNTARVYRYMFDVCAQGEQRYKGTTALGVSSAVLRDLKTKGAATLSIPENLPGGRAGNLIGGLLGAMTKSGDDPLMRTGTLTRIEPDAVPFKVIVNDEPTQLPAIHGRGKLGDDHAEFWLLDDEDNPLSLRWQIGSTDRLQVIRISFPPDPSVAAATVPMKPSAAPPPAPGPTPASHIEADLAKTGRTVVYGIYFDFASDHIKPESQPVLAEIARVMKDNPTWVLSVEGHTDSVGGDGYNLELSTRRAASVKQALVTQFDIDAKRLQPSGYGASRPKDTNTTLEGRARNRRVELAKLN